MSNGSKIPIEIRAYFPDLTEGNTEVTSPASRKYNCIAFAAGDESRWWWPEYGYWPLGCVRAVAIQAFQSAFESLGYSLCADAHLEPSVEKIAIFHINSEPTHGARQLENGSWVSKLGNGHDIRHNLSEVGGTMYGEVAFIMKRPRG